MYNNDIYDIIIEESHHIQDAITQSGSSLSPDYTQILSSIETKLNSIVAYTHKNNISRLYTKAINASAYASAESKSIADLFELPTDTVGAVPKFFSCGLYAYDSTQGYNKIVDNGCIIQVKDSSDNLYTISNHGSFALDGAVGRAVFGSLYIGDFTGISGGDIVIVGVFPYTYN